jgi:hypothetical protein
MRDATVPSQDTDQSPDRGYRAQVLVSPEMDPRGLCHLESGDPVLLGWEAVRLAIAAEIGEPEGVRTIVFDLIAAEGSGPWVAYRIDAEPGAEAMLCARELTDHLTSEACGPSIKSLATDGIPSRWYPDLASFEEDALELLESQG